MLSFHAVDVETANVNRASICQIGIVTVQDGQITQEWQSLVNPEDWFDPYNVAIHGISAHTVQQSPTMPELRAELSARFTLPTVVSHSAFDRIAFERAFARYALEPLPIRWRDSALVARRVWPEQYAQRGYGLKNIATDLGITFHHHDALEDARTCARILLHAYAHAGATVLSLLKEGISTPVRQPRQKVYPLSGRRVKSDGLHGKKVMFTGRLSMTRREAKELVTLAGGAVYSNATRGVTTLVVGTQNAQQQNGYAKSSKHRQIEQLITDGCSIDILTEEDFVELLSLKVVSDSNDV